jgi:hypothetical protein
MEPGRRVNLDLLQVMPRLHLEDGFNGDVEGVTTEELSATFIAKRHRRQKTSLKVCLRVRRITSAFSG